MRELFRNQGLIVSRFIAALMLILSTTAKGQDAQLSQFFASPMMFNPAKTGVLKHTDIRVSALYRNQWSSLSSSINTFQLSYDRQVGKRIGAGGGILNTNFAGILNSTNILLSTGYKISDPNQRKFSLSVGAQLGILYKSIRTEDFVFSDQFDGFVFDPQLPTGEGSFNRNRLMLDATFGISFESTDRKKNVNFYGDLVVFHVNMPNESFRNEAESRLPIRWVGNLGAKINVNKQFYLDPSLLLMKQASSEQALLSLIGTCEVQGTPYHLIGGVGYRSSDAAIVYLGFRHNANVFRLSYDINSSQITDNTQNIGAIEFSVIYKPSRRTTRVLF